MVRQRIANFLFRIVAVLLFRTDKAELSKIPFDGPGLIITNHVSYMEGPLLYVFLSPRKMTALAKIQLWKNPFTRFFMEAWGLIPVDRGGYGREAIRRGIEALDEGKYLGIAPEGTRSRDGCLIRAHRGAAYFALERKVPVYPVAHWGLTGWNRYILKPGRCPVSIRVGRPFMVNATGEVTQEMRREISDEIMYRIAELLPVKYRGVYTDMSKSGGRYLVDWNNATGSVHG